MKKLYIILCVLLISSNYIYALTWDKCIKRYQEAKQFNDNPRLLYVYLKSTKTCLINFKNYLEENPNSDFTIEAMNNNILMLDKNINNIIPQYTFPKNTLENIPKYLDNNTDIPVFNEEYNYFKKYKNCNGIHAKDKIYTAKHCDIEKSKNIRFDLNVIETKNISSLNISKLKLDKIGTYKYYSMSKEGMFYNSLLEEKNCKFYEAETSVIGLNKTLDLTDLSKKTEIRSNCLAIPSNSGGGVFQEGKLVGIISKTVFNKNEFLYSIVEPILPIIEIELTSLE